MKPWWDGILSPAEAEELDRQGWIRERVAKYLNEPKPRRVSTLDHGPWDVKNLLCLGCNRTQLELYSTLVMPLCK